MQTDRLSRKALALVLMILLAGAVNYTPPIQAASGSNLIPNPSVETASTSPSSVPLSWYKGGYGVNTRTLTYPVDGADGSKALRVEITAYTSGDAKWFFEPVPVAGGETYTLSDKYRSNVPSTVDLQYRLADGTYKYPDVAVDLPASADWTDWSTTFTVPTNYPSPVVNVSVFHLIQGVGWLETDAYSMADNSGGSGTTTPPEGTSTPDTEAPFVSVASVPNQPVSGTISLSATSSDNVGVAGVQFFLDNTAFGAEDSTSPYAVSWNTASSTDGAHSVFAVARDAAGNSATSSAIAINVGNSTGTSTPPTGTSTPPTSNLILNGSMETASTSPSSVPLGWYKGGYGSNTRTLTYPVAGIDGAKALRTEVTAYTSGDAKWFFEPVPVSGGQHYTLSDMYRSNIPSTVDLQYQLADGTYKYTDLAIDLPASSDWTGFSKTFTVPTNYASPVKNVTAFHLIQGVGWVDTDAFDLEAGSSSGTTTPPTGTTTPPTGTTTPPVDDGLLKNGSLEQADPHNSSLPAGWTFTHAAGTAATAAYPVTSYDGSKAAEITVTNVGNGFGADWYSDAIPVEGGDEYRFTDHFKSTAESWVEIEYQMSDGSYQYLDLLRLAPTAGAWKEGSNTFMVPQGAESMTIYHLLQKNGTLDTDNYSLEKLPSGAFDQGMITLEFDDSLASQYENALPILRDGGVTAGFYVITRALNESGYMTTAQVKDLQAQGFEVGAHTRNHPYLTTVSPTRLHNEVAGSKADLENMGIEVNDFVYPYGDYNDIVEQEVENDGFAGARSVRSGFNTKNTDPYALMDEHIENTTTIEDVKDWIDEAEAAHTWLIFEIHEVVPDTTGDQYATTPELLQEIVDYIKQSGIKVVSTKEGLQMMKS
ncbi:MAG TPA: polysaccharide deacetylase family protein [Candidatus Paceibacterota bacterium]|nr:polysaccharide deacetylase family protein [Candidatus Paceibacterota bacterium]